MARRDLSTTALYTAHAQFWGDLSCADLFFQDDARSAFGVTNFVLGLRRLFRWRQPSLAAGIVQRHVMIDELLRRSSADQVLELACGFSRRGAAFSEDSALEYVEVDLPAVVALKRELLARTEQGQEVAFRENLRWVSADVEKAHLARLVDASRSTFVIAEGLFMYLDCERQRRLWREIASVLGSARGGTFVFDLVPGCEQPPGLMDRFFGGLMGLFTGGRGFVTDDRTREDIACELREAGFDGVELMEPGDVDEDWALPFKGESTKQLLFVCRCHGTGEKESDDS